MQAGRLDRRVTIERLGPAVDDGLRSKPAGWLKVATRWAELAALSGAERVVAAENAASETLKFRVRRDSVTSAIDPADHRLLYSGRPFDIQAKQEVGKHAFDLLVTGRSEPIAVSETP